MFWLYERMSVYMRLLSTVLNTCADLLSERRLFVVVVVVGLNRHDAANKP
jgi:hypothetical protein